MNEQFNPMTGQPADGYCPHCRTAANEEATHCAACGLRVRSWVPCEECREPISVDAKMCPHCHEKVQTHIDGAVRDLEVEICCTRMGAFLTGGFNLTRLFFPPTIRVSNGRIHMIKWSFLGLRRHHHEIQVTRVASVRYTKGVIWASLTVETFGGASEDLTERGFDQDEAYEMSEQLKAVLSDR